MAGSKEYKALVNCTTSLVDHFAAGNVGTIGRELHSKGLIPYESYTEIEIAGTPEDKAVKIARAVTRTVKAQPRKFVNLAEILKNQDMLDLDEILQDELSTLLFTLTS